MASEENAKAGKVIELSDSDGIFVAKKGILELPFERKTAFDKLKEPAEFRADTNVLMVMGVKILPGDVDEEPGSTNSDEMQLKRADIENEGFCVSLAYFRTKSDNGPRETTGSKPEDEKQKGFGALKSRIETFFRYDGDSFIQLLRQNLQSEKQRLAGADNKTIAKALLNIIANSRPVYALVDLNHKMNVNNYSILLDFAKKISPSAAVIVLKRPEGRMMGIDI
jgi:hypothetical protein